MAAGRMLAGIGLPLSGLLLLIAFAKYLHFIVFALRFPYGLDYGEGIVWQQMRSIVAGRGYAPIGVYPSIVFHYPPLFHLAAAATAAAGGIDQLTAGRLVSIVSALTSMVLAALLTTSAMPATEPRMRRWIVGLFAALCPAAIYEVVIWSVMMRVDLMAIMLGLAGLLLAMHAQARPKLIYAAALLFTLSVYTKQTSIAAPAAAFVALLVVRPQQAFVLFGTCLALGLAALIFLSVQTQGGFLVHIVTYNVNRFDLRLARGLLRNETSEFFFLALAATGALAGWRRLRGPGWSSFRARLRQDHHLFALFVLLLFLSIRLAMMPMMLKSGASTNYLVEWMFVVSMFAALSILPVLRFAAGEAARPPFPVLVLLAFGLLYQVLILPDFTPPRSAQTHQIADAQALVARFRAATKPVISDDMVLLIRAGRPVMWEPAIEAELGHAGRYDERAFARLVRARAFAFFATVGDRGNSPYDERYNPVVADAIDDAYPVRQDADGLVIHLPQP